MGTAQEIDALNEQLWVDYNPRWAPAKQWLIFGDIGYRTQLDYPNTKFFVLRPGVQRILSRRVWIGGGIGSFYTVNQIIADRWEMRPWQGVDVRWQELPVPVETYLRLEERFEFNTETGDLAASVRARLRVRAYHQWEDWFGLNRYWRLFLGIEGFARLVGDAAQFEHQARLTLGLDRSFKYSLRLRGEITWQKSTFFFFGDTSVNALYFRVRLYQRFGR
jgi:hypothetical protein